MRERWERFLEATTSSTLTLPYLQEVFPQNTTNDNLYINGAVFANPTIAIAVKALKTGDVLAKGDMIIAFRTDKAINSTEELPTTGNVEYDGDAHALQNVWDIFANNGNAIRGDYRCV